MSPFLTAYIEKIIQYPWRVIVFFTLFVIILSSGLPNLSISNDFRVYLSKSNPQLKAFEDFEDDYVKSDTATLVVTAKNEDLFNREGLSLIESLTEEAWNINYAYRVSSIANYTISHADGDDIYSEYLVEDAARLSDEKVKNIKVRALAEQRLVKTLLTSDGKLSIIFITLNLPKDKKNAAIEVTTEVEQLRDKYRIQYPNFEIDNGGSTAFNATLARAVAKDLTTLLPLSYLIIFGGLVFFLRSAIGSLTIFTLISLCLISTFGFFGWISPVLTPIAGFTPSILLSIMVADSVHLLVTYYRHIQSGESKNKAILESLKLNFMPVLITSVTTIIGFLSLNFSASPPYQALGNMVAFGVLVALIFSLVLLPAMLKVIPPGKIRQAKAIYRFSSFSNFLIKYYRLFLVSMLLLTCALVAFIPSNKVSDNWANYFDNSFELIQLVNRLDGYLTGINSLEYSLKPKASHSIFSPEYLAQLDEFESWFISQPKVVNVKSLSELMKDLNQVMNADQPEFYRVPDSAELAAQYLLFYEFGLPQGLGLNDLVTIHKDASRFSVSVTNSGSEELLQLDRLAQNWLQKNANAIEPSQATGLGMVFAHIAQRNISSLLFGTFIALIAISIVLVLVLKSFRFGIISLIPNLVPAAMAYGLWGLSFGYIDIALSIVACSTLGIVVDDTVHFLHKYQLAREQGKDAKAAIKETFERVGLALLTTSLVLSGGFLILAISSMNTSATIGLLMAITLTFALIVDFLLLPTLLILFDKSKLSNNNRQ
ncbi:RND family transporter [Aliikangiella sp. G2MR2-5]|uniref:efflux RND transporter permease subunit n=1 Tax=Aliikangiella sp. G2MR2-5 TaxID=2788943 RepID=UPI0018AC647B|nr:efflux RND transporter permease subunit [Aliikangiella sp. G2MR2-5]